MLKSKDETPPQSPKFALVLRDSRRSGRSPQGSPKFGRSFSLTNKIRKRSLSRHHERESGDSRGKGVD